MQTSKFEVGLVRHTDNMAIRMIMIKSANSKQSSIATQGSGTRPGAVSTRSRGCFNGERR